MTPHQEDCFVGTSSTNARGIDRPAIAVENQNYAVILQKKMCMVSEVRSMGLKNEKEKFGMHLLNYILIFHRFCRSWNRYPYRI